MISLKSKNTSGVKDLMDSGDYSNIKKDLNSVGIIPEDKSSHGQYVQIDDTFYYDCSEIEGLEIFPIMEVLKNSEVIEKYFQGIASGVSQKLSDLRDEKDLTGFYIRVAKGIKILKPVKTAFLLNSEMSLMNIYNIVIVEDNASLNLVTGCTSGINIQKGVHCPVTEHYVGDNAELTSTMIHNWGNQIVVKPESRTRVGRNGKYTDNYYCLSPSKNTELDPMIHLVGDGSTAKIKSVTTSFANTRSSIKGSIKMDGENTGAEISAKSVNNGGTIFQKGTIEASAKNARGHVDCSGLLMSDNGVIEAVPGLISRHPDVILSHEAAIGRVDRGEVNYLQSKGLSETEATSLIVRGFLDIKNDDIIIDAGFEELLSSIANSSGH